MGGEQNGSAPSDWKCEKDRVLFYWGSCFAFVFCGGAVGLASLLGWDSPPTALLILELCNSPLVCLALLPPPYVCASLLGFGFLGFIFVFALVAGLLAAKILHDSKKVILHFCAMGGWCGGCGGSSPPFLWALHIGWWRAKRFLPSRNSKRWAILEFCSVGVGQRALSYSRLPLGLLKNLWCPPLGGGSPSLCLRRWLRILDC